MNNKVFNNPFQPGYYSSDDLIDFGFESVGKNVLVAKNCTIVGVENIAIGDNVRIDGFSTIIANGKSCLKIGSWVHIGGYSFLAASEGLVFEDFSGISQGVRIYTGSDDYSGKALTNPTVPAQYTNVQRGKVSLGKHCIIGSGTVILPGVTLQEGVAVGALSLVTKSLEAWGVYLGVPVKRITRRKTDLLNLEESLRGGQS